MDTTPTSDQLAEVVDYLRDAASEGGIEFPAGTVDWFAAQVDAHRRDAEAVEPAGWYVFTFEAGTETHTSDPEYFDEPTPSSELAFVAGDFAASYGGYGYHRVNEDGSPYEDDDEAAG